MASVEARDSKRLDAIETTIRQILRDHSAFVQAVEQLQRAARVLEDYKLMFPLAARISPAPGESTLRRIAGRIMVILLARDIEPAELQGTLAAMIWGIWFFIGSAGSGGVYNVLFDVAKPWVWSIVFLALGVFQAFGLIANRWRLRRLGALLAVFCWLTVAVLIALVDWRFISAATSFGFALGAGWGYLRLRLDTNAAAGRAHQ